MMGSGLGQRRKALKRLLVSMGLALVALCLYAVPHGGRVERSGVWIPLAGFRRGSTPSLTYDVKPERDDVIPRIIHQTWKSRDVPALMESWVNTWLPWKEGQQDWEYWFWTDEDIMRLIQTKYPDYVDLFESFPDNAYRADAFRYFVLYEYGGLYADLDTERRLPLDDVVRAHTCIISQEPVEHAHFLSPLGAPLVSNAIMACRPGHPFFETVIAHLDSFTGWFQWNGILDATGPYMLTEIYRSHFQGAEETVGLHLADPIDFQPTIDNSMLDRIREVCLLSVGRSFPSEAFLHQQEKICKRVTSINFRNSPAENSYTDHHWTHSWAGPRHDPWGILNSKRTFRIE